MKPQHELPTKQKVYAYILRNNPAGRQLLVFDHVDFPEAGTQVPGGTVEPGEDLNNAVLREILEESGLKDLRFVQKLGVVRRDMREYGMRAIHERHYFNLTARIPCVKHGFHMKRLPQMAPRDQLP